MSPDGYIYERYNTCQIAEEFGLKSRSIRLVLEGKVITHLGWQFSFKKEFLTKNEIRVLRGRNSRDFLAISPEGEEVIFKNTALFAELNNLKRAGIKDCLTKRQKTHKGWRFEYLNDK